jgi:hypothetical protein
MTSSALLTDVVLLSSGLLAIIVGVAFIGLGGVNFVFLMVSSNLVSTFLVLEEEVPTELKVLLTLSCTLTSLSKHTTEDPAPGCLSRRRIARMIYFKL